MMVQHISNFLISQHPHSARQFIIGVFAEWAERQYQKASGNFDKADAIRGYLKALRHSLDTRLLLQPSQAYFRKKRNILDVSLAASTRRKHETLSLIESMSPDEAVAFLAEVTATWCFSMPEDFIPLMPVPPRHRNDRSIARAIYEWFVRYFDLWP
jgi:hypothetical protein